MKRRTSRLLPAVAVAFAVLLLPAAVVAQGLPEGVKAEVVATYPSKLDGIQEIRLVKFTFQPGAVLKDFKVKDTGL